VDRLGRSSRASSRRRDRLHREGETERIQVLCAGAYELELGNLADAIAGTGPALLGREDALGRARTIDALYRAAETRASVSL
jgi:predicted dehydrogenase